MQAEAGGGAAVAPGAGSGVGVAAGFRRSVLFQWAGVAVFVLAAAALAVRGDWMWRFDQTLYDTALRLWQRAPSADIVIVGVNEASLAQLGGWPFARSLHAQVVDRLTRAGAKAIGFDVIFAEPSAPAEDARFAAAIAASGRVVLPVHMDGTPGGKAREIRPVAALAAHARLAHVHIELDADGMARSVYLREGAGTPEFPHLSAALVMAARGDDTPLPGMRRPTGAADPQAWVRDYWLHIPFSGPPGHFATVSYVDVLRGRVADTVFRDRIVLVGAVAPGMLDAYPTPVSGGARAMPGVEISAQAIDAILLGADIRPLDASARMGLSLLLLLPLLAGLLWLEPRRAFLLAAGSSALILLLAVLAARYPGVWFAPSVPALAALLAYPFWSWRRLEATQRFLEGEVEAMSGEPGIIDAPAQRRWRDIADPIERRIAVVRNASSRLRAARRFIADVVDHQPQATLVADAQGRVVLGNQQAAALCGTGDTAGLRGRALGDLLATLRTPQGEALAAVLLPGGAPVEAQSGDGRAWLASAAPLSGEDAQPLGSIVSLADITELRDAQKKREEYMAFLSHDMRSPQVSIIALLELAKLAPERTPGDLAERIEAHARKTLSLADDFVQLARAEEKDPASFVPLDLNAVLREAVDEQTALAARKFITIEVKASPQALMISGDRELLVRVISNLLSNSVKYSHGGRAIYCSLVRLDDGAGGAQSACELRIRDQGFGIAAEDLPRLFDRFSRFDAPGASRNAGSGLGLAFVKTVLDKHAAHVDVQSAPDVGTTFSLRFALIGGGA